MVTIQPIHYRGCVVALVAGGRALIAEGLAGEALALVRGKCLYALEVHAGEQPGPYSEQAATRYARHALERAHRRARLSARPRR